MLQSSVTQIDCENSRGDTRNIKTFDLRKFIYTETKLERPHKTHDSKKGGFSLNAQTFWVNYPMI